MKYRSSNLFRIKSAGFMGFSNIACILAVGYLPYMLIVLMSILNLRFSFGREFVFFLIFINAIMHVFISFLILKEYKAIETWMIKLFAFFYLVISLIYMLFVLLVVGVSLSDFTWH